MRNRLGAAPAAGALAALAWAACASGPIEPIIDLTPFTWTWSQISFGDTVIRYAFPEEPAPTGDEAAPFGLVPVGPGASEKRLASYHYGCARADRGPDAACTVFLDFWLLELEPPLADVTLAAHRARLERVYGDPLPRADTRGSEIVRDSRGREWYHRALALESGAAFAHYSRPIDARRALAVTSLTTRAPDRIAARDLARDAIGRAAIIARHE